MLRFIKHFNFFESLVWDGGTFSKTFYYYCSVVYNKDKLH